MLLEVRDGAVPGELPGRLSDLPADPVDRDADRPVVLDPAGDRDLAALEERPALGREDLAEQRLANLVQEVAVAAAVPPPPVNRATSPRWPQEPRRRLLRPVPRLPQWRRGSGVGLTSPIGAP